MNLGGRALGGPQRERGGATVGQRRRVVAHKSLLARGACLPAPLSLHSESRLQPGTWTLASILPSHLPTRGRAGPWTEKRRGWSRQSAGPVPVSTSVVPSLQGTGAGWTSEAGASIRGRPLSPHAHLGSLYLFVPDLASRTECWACIE